MILRRVSLERYGSFGSTEFEFRRGLNLVSGGNDSGKSLLLATLPAALLGVDHGSRLRSWGDSLSCRVTLLFEGNQHAVRLARDLENNLVRIEESGADGAWRDCFNGVVPPAGTTAERDAYFDQIARLFSVRGEACLRALLETARTEVLFAPDGRLAEGLVPAATGREEKQPSPPPAASAKQRQMEIASLEADLAADRADYRKGEEYLAWVRKRWEHEAKGQKSAARGGGSGDDPLRQQRDQLAAELQRQGLPARLPEDLPEMFRTAEALRQELASLQLELTPLQRLKQEVDPPGFLLPLLATAVAVAASGVGYWQKLPWVLPLVAACGILLLVVWVVFLARLRGARREIAGLDQQIQAVEARRADALARQNVLAEKFEACGLPSSAVDMVKLQQLYRRNEELIARYRDLCSRLGEESPATPVAEQVKAGDRHLRPEDLPEAEARLAELGESLRQREVRLAALRNGTDDGAAILTRPSTGTGSWTESGLLQAVGQQLEKLSGGRFNQLRTDERCLRLEVAHGRWAPPAACSQGAVATLALAMRLALSQLTGSRLPLPVDDLLAILDTRRRQSVLRVLERHAADHQLLLAACDEELARRAARERWHVVNLNQSAQGAAAAEEEADAGQLHLL